jgi:effector-binding domain-containing protein
MFMSIKCELRVLKPQPSLSIRLRTNAEALPEVFAKGYSDIAGYLDKWNSEPAGAPFAIYYNLDTRNLDVEFGFPVSVSLSGIDNIRPSQTPSGKSVFCLHIGPYIDVEPSYRALTEWIKDYGYEAAGIVYEVYLNDPVDSDPEKLNTQVYELIRTIEL